MAAGDDLLCNFRKCRKRVNTFGWVTSCSHIFCDEDGTREFQKGYFCPACEANLSGKYDVVRVELQPSEQYKSMVLAGQRPEVIMEIASRALSFWTYQASQERTYQEFIANKFKEKISEMEQYYDQMISKAQAEISSHKHQISAKSKGLEETKKRLTEITEKLEDKTRQYSKLQGMYDSLRRKATITPNLMLEAEDKRQMDSRMEQVRNSFLFSLDTGANLLRTSSSSNVNPPAIPVQAEREFAIQHRLPAERPASCAGTPVCPTNHQIQKNFTVDFVSTPDLTRRLYRKK